MSECPSEGIFSGPGGVLARCREYSRRGGVTCGGGSIRSLVPVLICGFCWQRAALLLRCVQDQNPKTLKCVIVFRKGDGGRFCVGIRRNMVRTLEIVEKFDRWFASVIRHRGGRVFNIEDFN
jgi:hypothetical protein